MTQELTLENARTWIRGFRDVIAREAGTLTDLDSAIGDGDHGINMARGMAAVSDALTLDDATGPQANVADLLKKVGMTLVSTVGGAAGPLYGTFFLRMGTGALPESLSASDFGDALARGLDGVVARGKAELGDKTMIDALAPAVEAYRAALASGGDLASATVQAAAAAITGRDATIPLVARKGRASYLGERSAGHQDPGATSMAMLLSAAADAVA
ncbi:MAG: dihydroxyacetone kinase subunit DhaL [Micrococcales bacterium]|nr:dihydroxyacetone kinase subunit DhaL [Micrococcales bacterium]